MLFIEKLQKGGGGGITGKGTASHMPKKSHCDAAKPAAAKA
jgi:hypothetical protein